MSQAQTIPTGGENARGRITALAAAAGTVVLGASAFVLTSSGTAQGADPVQICNSQLPEGSLDYTRPAEGWPESIPGGGELYLFYEGENGYNCAVTISNDTSASHVDVGLRRSDGTGPTETVQGSGTHAGPVYVEAPGVCVDVTGAVTEYSHTVTGTNCGA